jgi:hypothetical protein
MRTREGVSIRKTDQHRHKYACAMSEYLASRDDAYDGCDGDADSPTGWFTRFGRRMLRGDSRGFVWCETYPTAHDARAVFDALADVATTWHMLDDGDELPQQMSAWCAYVIACASEGLVAHDLDMWEVHGRPKGPIG